MERSKSCPVMDRLLHCLLLLTVITLLCGCRTAAPGQEPGEAAATVGPTPRPEQSPMAKLFPTLVPSPSPSPTPSPLALAYQEGIPARVVEQVLATLSRLPAGAVLVSEAPDILVAWQGTSGDRLAYERILVPVSRFSTLLTGISSQELRDVWTGASKAAGFQTIYPAEEAVADLEALLGPRSPAVKPQPSAVVVNAVWADPEGIGIVLFEALEPRLRALALDGLSATDNRLAQEEWPLARRAWLHPVTPWGADALAQVGGWKPISNRDPNKLTVLVMTGVTAMARGTAAAIEAAGDYAFPARIIGPELAAADITVISNEVPFVEGCVVNNTLNNLILCSKPEYFAALELSGVDVVGLTGNHQNDFGYDKMLASLAFYAAKGIPVYGGGANDEAARAPLILEHHGNRLAFLGANQFGPEAYLTGTGEQVSAWATEKTPGSARFDRLQMCAAIEDIRPQVDLVLAEVQHTEFNPAGDYQVEPLPEQMADFRALHDAGATIVTGVQAHTPQAIELYPDSIILYGLGNLYFDQTWSWPTRTGLVARHIIYDGRLLGTELLVTVIEMNKQLRWATPEERQDVLQTVFAASHWAWMSAQ